MLIIEESMTAQDVCDVMATKTHRARDPNYCIVEKLADLNIGNIFIIDFFKGFIIIYYYY